MKGRLGETRILLVICLLLVSGISGCGWWKDVKEWWRPPNLVRATPEALYKRGAEQYQEGRYTKAVESFRRVKEQFPLHKLAVNAELGIADAYFSDENYIEAEAAYSDFISLHPTNENIPYAMYQAGICYYNQIGTIDRDQTDVVKAKQAFDRLIARFPGSKFSLLAEKHLQECRRKLAEREFYIGEFYFKRSKYKAALGRFETIAREYSGLGLDYQAAYFIEQSKKRLARQEAEEKIGKEKKEKKENKKS